MAGNPRPMSSLQGSPEAAGAPARRRATPAIEAVAPASIAPASAAPGVTLGGITGAVLLAAIVIAAIAAPMLSPHAPNRQFDDGLGPDGAPLPPSWNFPLGTDLLGRDLLSRLLYGARVSLLIGLVANLAAVAFGASAGLIAGWFQGRIGSAVMRLTDLTMAFPALLLAIALAAVLHPSLWIVALVIALVNWVQVARVVFTETRSLSEREFVVAAISSGATPVRVLRVHVLPHLAPSILAFACLGIGTSVLLEATLSFLGVGVRPPTPSWGNIIEENESWMTAAPWLVLFPAAAILALALACNLLGDAIADRLDPFRDGRR